MKAAFLDGSLIFKSSDDRETFYPWCWSDFTVVNESGLAVWEFDVPYGAYEGGDDCGPNFPIHYGQAPQRAETMVPAQRLQIGRLYVINGSSAGHLEGAFKIERADGRLKVRNFDPNSGQALAARESYSAWQSDHDPPRISETPTSNAAFEVQAPPRSIPKRARAGSSGKDEFTWVLHPDEWWNLPSLSYQSLSGERTLFNLWCRYTGGPIYARVPFPAGRGAPLTLTSGSERLAMRLHGAGNPDRRDRVDAILPHDSRVLSNFVQSGDLTVESNKLKSELSAINGDERAIVKRFFELCADSSSEASPTLIH